MNEHFTESHGSDPNASAGKRSLPPDSPYVDLNATVLSIEWEITDAIMAKLLAEIDQLKERENDKTLQAFLQLHGSVGKYIRAKKVAAHPDSVRLLHSVHGTLVEILTRPEISEDEKAALLSEQIKKFKQLKAQLLASATPQIEKRPIPKEKPSVPGAAPAREPAAGADRLEAALAEIKQLIRQEFKTLREELKQKPPSER